jgi:hypothetical protein
MALNSLADFKQVLGVGSIYSDTLLQDCLDAADHIVLGLVIQNKYATVAHKKVLTDYTIWLDRPHDIYVGQSVVIANSGTGFNGTKTVTAVDTSEYSITFAGTSGTYPKHSIVPTGTCTLDQYVTYSSVPEVCEAAMAVACDIWMTRMNTVGQQGIDFQPAPYKLGRGLAQRVMGLLGNYIDTRGMVG